MNKSILTAAAAAVFSLVTFEGAQAGEKDFTATSDVALNKGDVSSTKGLAVDQQSLSNDKNEPTSKGEKPSHGSAGGGH